jgi:hypothetical protein
MGKPVDRAGRGSALKKSAAALSLAPALMLALHLPDAEFPQCFRPGFALDA